MQFECLDMDDFIGFDWDDGNIFKNEIKHNLKWQNIEEVFFNEPLMLLEDTKHSDELESRCVALGLIDDGRFLTVIFRNIKNKIRVIFARPISKKERSFYESFTNI